MRSRWEHECILSQRRNSYEVNVQASRPLRPGIRAAIQLKKIHPNMCKNKTKNIQCLCAKSNTFSTVQKAYFRDLQWWKHNVIFFLKNLYLTCENSPPIVHSLIWFWDFILLLFCCDIENGIYDCEISLVLVSSKMLVSWQPYSHIYVWKYWNRQQTRSELLCSLSLV